MLSSDLTTVGFDATAPGPPLIGALLRAGFETVRDRMLAGLHQRGYDDLVVAHLNVLQYPGPENLRPSDLAARTHMSKQALNYLLGQLEQLGYLTREDDPEDQRSKRIHLTPRGRAVITAIRELVHEVEAEWEQALGREQFGQLCDLLTQLYAIARPTGPPRTATA
jgi:DNA-binding MarR family transcriptional regulator